MVEQLYTNARTDTYKHPSRYVRAAVGIGRSARSGWVGAGQRALTSWAGYVGLVAGIGRGARSGWVELGWRMGRIGATRPHFGGGGTWGQLLEQGGVRAADGSERSNAPSLRGRGYLYSAGLIRMVGTERGLFGEIDTYSWGGARLIRWESYVCSGAAGGKQAASGRVCAANRYSVVD